MPYTTQTQLEIAAGGAERFAQLADFDGDGTADPAVVTSVLAEVGGWIDAHLRKFSPADLEALRVTPTDTIARIAAEEAIFRLRSKRQQVSEMDFKLQELRQKDLVDIRADRTRVGDVKSPRATFVENDGPITKDGTKGMW